MSQDAPSNASELVSERNGEDVVMQPSLGRLEPRLEAVALPALRLDQHNPCGLHEQDTQVAIAATPAQGPTMPVIGFLRSTSLAVSTPMVTGFRQSLATAGF